MMKNKNLKPAIDFINEFASDETKERFELDDILYDISMAIFNYRMENELSQKDLANILGVTQAMVSKLESGQYNPSVEQLWKISKSLNLKFTVSLEVKQDENTEIWEAQEYRMGNIDMDIPLMGCS